MLMHGLLTRICLDLPPSGPALEEDKTKRLLELKKNKLAVDKDTGVNLFKYFVQMKSGCNVYVRKFKPEYKAFSE